MRRSDPGRYVTGTEARGILRWSFLWTAAKLLPEILLSLRDDVIPVFVATRQECESLTDPSAAEELRAVCGRRYAPRTVHLGAGVVELARWRSVALARVTEAYVYGPELLELQAALKEWGERFHLREEWAMDASLTQLHLWGTHPPVGSVALKWWAFVGRLGPAPEEIPALEVALEPFSPGWETRAAYEARMLENYCKALTAQSDDVKALEAPLQADTDRWQQMPTRPALGLHMEWVVRRYVLKQPLSEIVATALKVKVDGQEAEASTKFVSRRVNALAREIGLPARS